MNNHEVIVWLHFGGENQEVGRLWFHRKQNRESASFEYSKNWLHHPEKFTLDPGLQLTPGTFHTQEGVRLFGALGDSAPDRWGQLLMRRAESKRETQKRKEEEKVNTSKHSPRPTLSELDYLLGVNDLARQGALRFSLPEEKNLFLASNNRKSIPPLISLPRLLAATERFLEEEESSADLKLLLAPGSSLGGARPKASLWDKNNKLAIVKFPRKDDEYQIILWEAVALSLAQQAGIRVAPWRIEIIANQPLLILQRFDRHQGERIPFLSAMSMLGARDHEQHSYLEIVYALEQHSAAPQEDLEELWRRLVFTIMIANTDDHLRNHGFLYQRYQGWRLSPAYDLNPTPIDIKPRILTTSIDFENNIASLDLAYSVASEFRLSLKRSKEICQEVAAAVKKWLPTALNLGISPKECKRMSSAFSIHP